MYNNYCMLVLSGTDRHGKSINLLVLLTGDCISGTSYLDSAVSVRVQVVGCL